MTPQHRITGVIVDTNNTPLEGVSVKIYCMFDRQVEQIGFGETRQTVSTSQISTPVVR